MGEFKNFDFVFHGIMASDFYQGCNNEDEFCGIGCNAKDACKDALDCALNNFDEVTISAELEQEIDEWIEKNLPDEESTIPENSFDVWHYVTLKLYM